MLSLMQPDYPPKIFYKIFTRRPVVDMGMFSPRNYSKERLEE